jgi:hypothetical protein
MEIDPVRLATIAKVRDTSPGSAQILRRTISFPKDPLVIGMAEETAMEEIAMEAQVAMAAKQAIEKRDHMVMMITELIPAAMAIGQLIDSTTMIVATVMVAPLDSLLVVVVTVLEVIVLKDHVSAIIAKEKVIWLENAPSLKKNEDLMEDSQEMVVANQDLVAAAVAAVKDTAEVVVEATVVAVMMEVVVEVEPEGSVMSPMEEALAQVEAGLISPDLEDGKKKRKMQHQVEMQAGMMLIVIVRQLWLIKKRMLGQRSPRRCLLNNRKKHPKMPGAKKKKKKIKFKKKKKIKINLIWKMMRMHGTENV